MTEYGHGGNGRLQGGAVARHLLKTTARLRCAPHADVLIRKGEKLKQLGAEVSKR